MKPKIVRNWKSPGRGLLSNYFILSFLKWNAEKELKKIDEEYLKCMVLKKHKDFKKMKATFRSHIGEHCALSSWWSMGYVHQRGYIAAENIWCPLCMISEHKARVRACVNIASNGYVKTWEIEMGSNVNCGRVSFIIQDSFRSVATNGL